MQRKQHSPSRPEQHKVKWIAYAFSTNCFSFQCFERCKTTFLLSQCLNDCKDAPLRALLYIDDVTPVKIKTKTKPRRNKTQQMHKTIIYSINYCHLLHGFFPIDERYAICACARRPVSRVWWLRWRLRWPLVVCGQRNQERTARIHSRTFTSFNYVFSCRLCRMSIIYANQLVVDLIPMRFSIISGVS